MKPLSTIILFFVVILSGCNTTHKEENQPINWDTLSFDTSYNHREVQCLEFSSEDKIFVYEKELARVEVKMDDLLEDLEAFHKKHPRIKDDAALIALLRKEEKTLSSTSLERRLRDRSVYRIEQLLADGKARVFDKRSSEYVSSYIAANFSYYFDPLFAGGGMIFIFKGTEVVFFEVQEWMS